MHKVTLDVTAAQWEQYEEQYGRLMHSITRRISGDNAVANLEDNYAELCLAAIESINGFHRKTGQTFSEMWENPLFDKYTKTCLWHSKNNRGKKISKKIPMLKKTFSMDYKHVDQQVYDDVTFSDLYFDDLRVNLGHKESQALDMILESNKFLTSGGKVNILALSRGMKCSWVVAKSLVSKIATALGSDL
jgi:hypothetical protein